MSNRLLSAIVSQLSPENQAGFLAEITLSEDRARITEPIVRQIREAPTRAQAAAILLRLRSLPPASICWSDVDAAIRERWGPSAPRWCRIRAAKMHRESERQEEGRQELRLAAGGYL